jgi:hypothetical protein
VLSGETQKAAGELGGIDETQISWNNRELGKQRDFSRIPSDLTQ